MNTETRNCQNCKKDFIIEPEDFQFYERIKVPPPTWCPFCRLQRRFAWRNERGLYYRSCDLCHKKIISMYPEKTKFPVYCRECWWSDKWDPLAYGADYDFSKPFFIQFGELLNGTPQVALQVSNSFNCDYSNQILDSKNCYLVTSAKGNEDCSYSYRLLNSKNVLDSSISLRVEYMYEGVDVTDSAEIYFSEDCSDSLGLMFCYDVRGSQNCFMSSNLRNASYVFRNERLTREDYLKRMKEINMGSFTKLSSYLEEFKNMKLSCLHKYTSKNNVVNFTGHSAKNSKNCFHCFNIAHDEDCRYSILLNNARDCVDINNGCCQMELCYECSTVGANASNVSFSADVWPEINNSTYCSSCRSGANYLFGCSSLRGRSYCILNKQYSEVDYWDMITRIKKHMDDMPYVDSLGRVYKYGEFFPSELSLFSYADSAAQDYMPLDKNGIVEGGFRWMEHEDREISVTIPSNEIPNDIGGVADLILGEVLECTHKKSCFKERCAGGFKITEFELQFYRKHNIALPRLCPNCRYYQRFKRVNPPRLWHRKCMKPGCENEFETSYSPERPEMIYCEDCYNKEIV